MEYQNAAVKLMELLEQHKDLLHSHQAKNPKFYDVYAKMIFMEQAAN